MELPFRLDLPLAVRCCCVTRFRLAQESQEGPDFVVNFVATDNDFAALTSQVILNFAFVAYLDDFRFDSKKSLGKIGDGDVGWGTAKYLTDALHQRQSDNCDSSCLPMTGALGDYKS